MTERKTVDWRGVRIRCRAPYVEPRVDPETKQRVCVWCAKPLISRTAAARFCSHNCRSNWWHSR